MRLLLDTHLLIWAADFQDERTSPLSQRALSLIRDDANDLIFSVASVWEMAVKSRLARPDFQADPTLLRRSLLRNGYAELAITGEHALRVADLPRIHNDPFDRLLVAQAAAEALTLLTADAKVARYGGRIELV